MGSFTSQDSVFSAPRRLAIARWLHELLRAILLAAVCAAGGAWAASITIAVASSPLSTPLYVAEKQGYFRDEKLDIVIAECPNGGVCIKQLLDGQVQLATASDLPIMFRSFEATPFKVLTTFSTSNQDIKLVARKSAGIAATRDLKDKHVALVRGTAGQYFFDLALLSAGLDPRTVTVVDLDLKQLANAAADRQIDAFSLFQPGLYQMVKMLGDDALVLATPNLYTLSFNLITLRDKGAIADEDAVRILRALDRAMSFIKAEPAAAKAILRERLKTDAADVAALWPNYRFALSLNQSFIATLESTARWAIQETLVKAKDIPNYLDYVDVGPLRRVRPAAVTVVK